ncbi:hypothetical protein KCU89_g3873, partial [Aureobasidium melanogenum]
MTDRKIKTLCQKILAAKGPKQKGKSREAQEQQQQQQLRSSSPSNSNHSTNPAANNARSRKKPSAAGRRHKQEKGRSHKQEKDRSHKSRHREHRSHDSRPFPGAQRHPEASIPYAGLHPSYLEHANNSRPFSGSQQYLMTPHAGFSMYPSHLNYTSASRSFPGNQQYPATPHIGLSMQQSHLDYASAGRSFPETQQYFPEPRHFDGRHHPEQPTYDNQPFQRPSDYKILTKRMVVIPTASLGSSSFQDCSKAFDRKAQEDANITKLIVILAASLWPSSLKDCRPASAGAMPAAQQHDVCSIPQVSQDDIARFQSFKESYAIKNVGRNTNADLAAGQSTTKRAGHRDQHKIFSLYLKSTLTSLSPYLSPSPPSRDIKPPSNLLSIPSTTMQTQALMGRGGYNRISAPVLGRGGYNRDIKTSGISRPSNPSSLVVRSARCVASDDGRGGYN